MQFRGNNFFLDVPDGWQDSSIISFVAKVAPNEFAPNVVITREPFAPEASVEDFAARQLAVTQTKVEGLEIIERIIFNLDGKPAVQIVQKISAHGLYLQQLQTFILTNDEIFIITCTATASSFERHLTRFQSVVQSFQIDGQ